jgi:hypothetical protein
MRPPDAPRASITLDIVAPGDKVAIEHGVFV